jgi:hypothetical protein
MPNNFMTGAGLVDPGQISDMPNFIRRKAFNLNEGS